MYKIDRMTGKTYMTTGRFWILIPDSYEEMKKFDNEILQKIIDDSTLYKNK